jgi:hypothetical protein
MVDPSAYAERAQLQQQALKGGENITPQQAKAIAHLADFGRIGNPSPTRVVASVSKLKPFKKPQHSAWSLPIPAYQLGKLLSSFSPEAGKDDKWYIYADGPDADGHAALHMNSSTGEPWFKLDIKTTGDEEDENEAWNAEITAITWETHEDRVRHPSEEMAKFRVLEACNWVLGVQLVEEIKEPPEWDNLPTVLPIVRQTLYRAGWVSDEGLEQLKKPGAVIMF